MTTNSAKRYELVPEDTIVLNLGLRETTLFRIRALIDIPKIGVKIGDLGGYVQHEGNLSQNLYSQAWVFDVACVWGNACIEEQAYIGGQVCVCDCANVSGAAVVMGDACISGCAVVGDKTHITGHVNISGKAIVWGHASLHDNVRVSDAASVGGNATILGDVGIMENAYVAGLARLAGHMIIRGTTRITGSPVLVGDGTIKSNADWIHIQSCDCGLSGLTAYRTTVGDIHVDVAEWSGTLQEAIEDMAESGKPYWRLLVDYFGVPKPVSTAANNSGTTAPHHPCA